MRAVNRLLLTLIVLLQVAFCKQAFAQWPGKPNAIWDNTIYTLKDGMPVPQLTRIYKDVSGTIWAGGQGGLFRFDGYAFTSYSEGLNNTWVRCITGDSSGVIYAGTFGGLAIVRNNKVTVFKLVTDSVKQVDAVYLLNQKEMLAASKDEVWLIRMNNTAWKATKLFVLPYKRINVNNFAKDATGKIYVSTNAGFFLYHKDKLELLDEVNSRHVGIDRYNNIWYTTRVLKKLTWTSRGPVIQQFSVYPGIDSLSATTIAGFYMDRDEILLYTDLGGSMIPGEPAVEGGYYFLTRHLVKTNEQTYLKGVASDSLGFTLGVTADNEGNYWLANAQALTRLKLLNYLETTSSVGIAKGTLAESKVINGVRYVATEREGLFKVVGDKYIKDKYWGRKVSDGGMDSVEVQEVLVVSNGDVWCVTSGQGIFRKKAEDGVDGRWINYTRQSDSLKTMWFMAMIEAKNGYLYFGGNNTVAVYDGQRFFSLDNRHGYPDNETTASMFDEDSAGNILIATNRGLFSYRDGKTVNIGKELGMETCIMPWVKVARDKTIWVATYGRGALQLEYTNGKYKLIRQVTTKDGLSDNFVQVILPDNNGRIWTANFGGYNLITPIGAVNKVTRITSRMLLEKYYWRGLGLIMDGSGNVFGTTSKGQLRLTIPPGEVKDTIVTIPLYITGFKVFNKDIEPKPGDAVRFPLYLNVPEHPVLKHNQNHLTISFAGLYYTDPSNLKYTYILEGGPDEWTPLSNTRSVTYSHLPPGGYVFKVKADINGNLTPVVEYPFTIKAPWWQTLYFKIAMGILLLVVLGTIFYYINRRRIRNAERKVQQLQLDAERKEEIEAMEQSINENKLKALQAQMNPHFIFNVLSSLQNYIRGGDTTQSEKLLIDFGGLIRKSLDISGQNYISIEQEINYLKEYIKVEQQRTGNIFDYSIHIDESLAEPDKFYMPGMLLQPLVENAILHGLVPKTDGKGKLGIFMQLLAGNLLECVIKDNGPGIKEPVIKTHKPVAVNNIMERLYLYSKHLGKDIFFDIKSINAGEKEVSGTEATIHIPCFVLAGVNKDQLIKLN
jgi:ligand-binding sensor domain-containing protein